MQITFENEEERERLIRMMDNSIHELEINVRDRILLMGIKNILLFWKIETENGSVQAVYEVMPDKLLPAPKNNKKARVNNERG